MNTTPTQESPMTRDNRAIGKKAKKVGKDFESLFETICAGVGVACTRVPDGCKQVGVDRLFRPRLIRVKSPFDWIISHKGRTALLDTKTVNDKNFGFSGIDPDQVRELLKHEQASSIGGYVIWLRESQKVVFIPASILADKIGQRGSFKDTDPGVVVLGDLALFPLAGKISLTGIFKAASRSTGLTYDQVTGRSPIASSDSEQGRNDE